MNGRSILMALALVAPLAACDPTDGGNGAGAVNVLYRAWSVNDSSIPRLSPLDDPSGDCLLLQRGGTIALYADGRFTMSLSSGAAICGGAPQSEQGFSIIGTYERGADGITFNSTNSPSVFVGEYYPVPLGSTDPIPEFRPFTLTVGGYRYGFGRDEADSGWP